MANILKEMEGSQQRRANQKKKPQSVDFNEIQIHVSQSKEVAWNFDQAFHNWDDPLKCSGRKRRNCLICDELDKDLPVTRNSDGKIFNKNY